MKMRKGACGMLVMMIAAGAAAMASAQEVIEGPVLTNNIAGWPSSGMRFEALQDVTFLSFVFNNQGQSDTIQFWDRTDNALVGSVPIEPGSGPELQVDVEWALIGGHIYDLININGNNGRWIEYTSYPTSNSHLSVMGVVDIGLNVHTTWWFTFRFLTTGEAGPQIELGGSCPGQMTVSGRNMSPGGSVAFIYAFGPGAVIIPTGPCAGTMLDLDGTARLAGTAGANANGDVVFSGFVPAAACGRVLVQALDVSTCGTSNVESL